MNMSEREIGIDDLAKWFVNYVKRLKLANELGCSGPRNLEWACCLPHHHFKEEVRVIEQIARRLNPLQEKGLVLSENWWREVGQDEAADMEKV
ncbi:hypothetical protein HQ571_01990 [Candidatus Kuenenbacteria bacterium]|nr:hypothetical protein [Candidatus Kuenenbacteria bacterium]